MEYNPISILYKFQIDISSNSREIKYQNIGRTHRYTDTQTDRQTDRVKTIPRNPLRGRGNKANVVSWLLTCTCWYIITNKSNLIIITEMSVVFVYYAHKVVIVYTFCVICTYLHMYRCVICTYLHMYRCKIPV